MERERGPGIVSPRSVRATDSPPAAALPPRASARRPSRPPCQALAEPRRGVGLVPPTEIANAGPASFAATVGVAYESTGGDAMMPYQARAICPFGAATTTRFSTAPDEAPKTNDALPVASVTFWNGPLKTVAPTTGLPV